MVQVRVTCMSMFPILSGVDGCMHTCRGHLAVQMRLGLHRPTPIHLHPLTAPSTAAPLIQAEHYPQARSLHPPPRYGVNLVVGAQPVFDAAATLLICRGGVVDGIMSEQALA